MRERHTPSFCRQDRGGGPCGVPTDALRVLRHSWQPLSGESGGSQLTNCDEQNIWVLG